MIRPTTPLIAVDIIIELLDQPLDTHGYHPIVLIERRNPPHGWALPGGFVDVGETIEHAAIREALEETCLQVQLKTLLGIYSDPKRDSRGHTVSPVYIASAKGLPKAEDDAMNVQIASIETWLIQSHQLAFDHAQILNDYQQYQESRHLTPLLNF